MKEPWGLGMKAFESLIGLEGMKCLFIQVTAKGIPNREH
jgi:hypothetical protein